MMAAEHRRDSDDSDGRAPSLPETERRAREKNEAEDHEGRHSGSPSLPEAERRARENEDRED